ncbi:hypothetical protein AB0I84_42475 [Streptomyces spectabilis]|uniref:Uncharacterized protein n=1 Tax=Streptomyces spectabilis TaxID=68270 RepID=A0A516R3Q2_STRST|nr:hypothetical protein [Streptomyces spectabilis]MCI3901171.1 hypothetical protein [Streptomyces spectabilis]QDQ10290.1 hypothetical protein FH965_06715 [Streptomyces spectabilis]QEV58661.1 hypothetical protein CP982_07940 [Streptomyces spectabilis]GGV46399.1 hypothetical protein GCM10010245_72820 [Streptomyces spectabilis]
MPLTPQPHGSVRSSTELNERIRGLWLRAGGRLSADQRREYEQLVTEWAEAVRAEVVQAA